MVNEAARPCDPVQTTAIHGELLQFPTRSLSQLSPYGEAGYSEETSLTQAIDLGHWQAVSFRLDSGLGKGPLRFRPAPFPSFVQIATAEIRDLPFGGTIWSTASSASPGQLQPAGSMHELSIGPPSAFFNSGFNADLTFPLISGKGPVSVEFVMRVDCDLDRVRQYLVSLERENREFRKSNETSAALRCELETSYRERLVLVAETKLLSAEKITAEREWRQAARANEAIERQLADIFGRPICLAENDRDGAWLPEAYMADLRKLKERAEQLESDLESSRLMLSQIFRSKSWRLTEPSRKLARNIRKRLSG